MIVATAGAFFGRKEPAVQLKAVARSQPDISGFRRLFPSLLGIIPNGLKRHDMLKPTQCKEERENKKCGRDKTG